MTIEPRVSFRRAPGRSVERKVARVPLFGTWVLGLSSVCPTGTKTFLVYGTFKGRPLKTSSHSIPNVGLSITQDRLALTIKRVSGNMWVLDKVDR
jgi:hypothetical protein